MVPDSLRPQASLEKRGIAVMACTANRKDAGRLLKPAAIYNYYYFFPEAAMINTNFIPFATGPIRNLAVASGRPRVKSA